MKKTFEKDSRIGKVIISQAVVIKVLNASYSIGYSVRHKYTYFDINNNEYGRIEVRQASESGIDRLQGYRFITRTKYRKDCDTYFFLAFDNDYKNIKYIYIIPNKGWIKNISNVTIYTHATNSKYDDYMIDPEIYNDILHDLELIIGNSTVFKIEDIKNWLGLKEKN